MKDNFFLPAIIFIVAIGLIAAYGFAVQTGYAASRIIDNDYSEVYRGLVVNNYGATNGLLVPNGNVGIGVTPNGDNKLQIFSNGITGIKVNTSGATSDTASGALGVIDGDDAGWGVTGYSSNSNGSGVFGYGNGGNVGVKGSTALDETGNGIGVYGVSGSGIGVKGQSNGVLSDTTSYDFYGAGPKSYFSGNVGIGEESLIYKLNVLGGSGGAAIRGASVGGVAGVKGESVSGYGVFGQSTNGHGVYGVSSSGYAGFFNGKVHAGQSITSNGTITSKGTYQLNTTLNSSQYDISSERYVFYLSQSVAGTATPLDSVILNRLCRDMDGCELIISILGNTGNAWSRVYKFNISESTYNWSSSRSDNAVDRDGIDNNNTINQFGDWDCYFGDFDTSIDANDTRADYGLGFGVINLKGGSYTTNDCRFIITD